MGVTYCDSLFQFQQRVRVWRYMIWGHMPVLSRSSLSTSLLHISMKLWGNLFGAYIGGGVELGMGALSVGGLG